MREWIKLGEIAVEIAADLKDNLDRVGAPVLEGWTDAPWRSASRRIGKGVPDLAGAAEQGRAGHLP